MKSKFLVPLTIFLILTAGLFLLFFAMFGDSIGGNDVKVVQDIHPTELRDKMNIVITEYDKTPSISAKQAAMAAIKAFPDLRRSKEITAQKNLMTYKDFKGFSKEALDKNLELKKRGYIDNMPVWIISFKDLELQRTGGMMDSNKKLAGVHQEENVIVDALSGEALFSFTFR